MQSKSAKKVPAMKANMLMDLLCLLWIVIRPGASGSALGSAVGIAGAAQGLQ